MFQLVPVGGSTGLVGGQIAESDHQVSISLEKMNAINFSEEDNLIETDLSVEGQDDTNNNEKLFEPNLTDDEEFEIPAFLRKQKY